MNKKRKGKFSHLTDKGDIQMVSVVEKATVRRQASAWGFIQLKPSTLKSISNHSLAKGNVFTTAKIAGIQGAKKTAELIPLCHPLPLDHIDISFKKLSNGIEVTAIATNTAKTGVEMEALTAVSLSLLTIYDMCKAVDDRMKLGPIHLLWKKKKDIKR